MMRGRGFLFALVGSVLSQVKADCGDRSIVLPKDAEKYKNCAVLDNYVSISGEDGEDIKVEGFPALTGLVTYDGWSGDHVKSISFDASVMGILEITDATNLESISFPNLKSINSLVITNADALRKIDAPKLHTIYHWLALTNTTSLKEFNISAVDKERDSENRVALNIGYTPGSEVNVGSFLDHRELTGNVILSNVSQGTVDSLLGNPSIALPTVELRESPMVKHVNYSAHQAANLTILGSGETILTLNGDTTVLTDGAIASARIRSLYVSGVKEMNTDRNNGKNPYDWRFDVGETHIVDNPLMKEAALGFNTHDRLTIAHNPALETIRFPLNHYGKPYQNFTIVNNTRLHLSAVVTGNMTEDSTYRESDVTIAKYQWVDSSTEHIYLQGNFDMDFFRLDAKYPHNNEYITGNIVINSTASDFNCGKLSLLNQPSYNGVPGATFTCNGKTTVRVESLATTLFTGYHVLIAFACIVFCYF